MAVPASSSSAHLQRVRQPRRDAEHRLLLAAFVAADLPDVHADLLGERGLRQAELGAATPDRRA